MPTDKRQRQRENRAKKQEERRKAERRQKLRRRAIRIVSIAAILVVGLGIPALLSRDADSSTTTTSTTTTTTSTTTTTTTTTTTVPPEAVPASYEDYRAQPTACGAEAPPPVEEMTFAAPEDQGISPDATVTATITTSCGDILATLDPAAAPETVNSFVFLAREGFFDGTVFHRIMPGFMIQGGDPTAIGNGGPGYIVPDEPPEAGFEYSRGVLAMANAGVAGSTGSQFFFVTAEDAGLPNTYSAFGNVEDSSDAIDAITSVPLTARPNTEVSLPLETVYIESVTIELTE